MFKLARPWLESEQGRQKSEQPPPSTETPQPVRVRSWAAAVCPLCLNPGACPALLAAPSRPGQGGAAGTPGIRQLRPGRAAGPPLPRPPWGRGAEQGSRYSIEEFPTHFFFSSLSFGK